MESESRRITEIIAKTLNETISSVSFDESTRNIVIKTRSRTNFDNLKALEDLGVKIEAIDVWSHVMIIEARANEIVYDEIEVRD